MVVVVKSFILQTPQPHARFTTTRALLSVGGAAACVCGGRIARIRSHVRRRSSSRHDRAAFTAPPPPRCSRRRRAPRLFSPLVPLRDSRTRARPPHTQCDKERGRPETRSRPPSPRFPRPLHRARRRPATARTQWWKRRRREKAIVILYSLAAAITSSSATEPPAATT